MDFLSAMMLVITVILLTLSFPRIYGDWLSFQNHLEGGEREPLLALLADKKLWMQRHFGFAVLALVMAKVVGGTSLVEMAPRLSQITAVYAAVSLMLAFVESLFAQKITAVLAEARESRRNGSDYP